MFRFILQVAFIRRVLQLGLIRFPLLAILVGALIAGLIYAYVVARAVTQRSDVPHVQSHSAH
jgi:hypothetical protein